MLSTLVSALCSSSSKCWLSVVRMYVGLNSVSRVPYTMAKFVVFEKVSETIYRSVDKNSLSDGSKTGINLGGGLLAGFAAAFVSQPADTMLSKINKTQGAPGEGNMTRLVKIGKELGLSGSYAGIGAR